MNNSEKSYYAIIEDKKRGKFSGAGPIQVAKKVASKKLKAGKEMEFYLDEVGGKKKRYGPYHARKDKKSGKVAVVKEKKVMNGGLLRDYFKTILKQTFINFNSNIQKNPKCFLNNQDNKTVTTNNDSIELIVRGDFTGKLKLWILDDISDMKRNSIIYFYPINNNYKFAIFDDDDRISYIMIYNNEKDISIVNMIDFFLNPFYLYIFIHFDLDKKIVLFWLKNIIPNILQEIKEELEKIYDLLYIKPENSNKQKAMIYVPDDSTLGIKKCVYPNLTFGILDETTKSFGSIILTEKPTNYYQLFLIKKEKPTFLNIFSKRRFYIYIQIPVINIEYMENLRIRRNTYNPSFHFCIHTSRNSNDLKITNINTRETSDFNTNFTFANIEMACHILLSIPEEFVNFSNVKEIARNIIEKLKK